MRACPGTGCGRGCDIAGNPCQAALEPDKLRIPGPRRRAGRRRNLITDRVRQLDWHSGTFDFQVIRSLYADAVFGEVIATVGTTNYDDCRPRPNPFVLLGQAVSAGGGSGPKATLTQLSGILRPANVAASLGRLPTSSCWLVRFRRGNGPACIGARFNSASATQVGVTDNTMFEDFPRAWGNVLDQGHQRSGLERFQRGTTGSSVSSPTLNNTNCHGQAAATPSGSANLDIARRASLGAEQQHWRQPGLVDEDGCRHQRDLSLVACGLRDQLRFCALLCRWRRGGQPDGRDTGDAWSRSSIRSLRCTRFSGHT